MFLRKREYDRLVERIQTLENECYRLKQNQFVHAADDGLLYSYSSSDITITDALNALAKHVGVRWKQLYRKPASIDVEKLPK